MLQIGKPAIFLDEYWARAQFEELRARLRRRKLRHPPICAAPEQAHSNAMAGHEITSYERRFFDLSQLRLAPLG